MRAWVPVRVISFHLGSLWRVHEPMPVHEQNEWATSLVDGVLLSVGSFRVPHRARLTRQDRCHNGGRKEHAREPHDPILPPERRLVVTWPAGGRAGTRAATAIRGPGSRQTAWAASGDDARSRFPAGRPGGGKSPRSRPCRAT